MTESQTAPRHTLHLGQLQHKVPQPEGEEITPILRIWHPICQVQLCKGSPSHLPSVQRSAPSRIPNSPASAGLLVPLWVSGQVAYLSQARQTYQKGLVRDKLLSWLLSSAMVFLQINMEGTTPSCLGKSPGGESTLPRLGFHKGPKNGLRDTLKLHPENMIASNDLAPHIGFLPFPL